VSLGSVVGDILAGPAKGLIDSVGSIIDNVSTTDEERAKARLALREVELAFSAKVLEAETAKLQAQASIIQTEAKSESWPARNWRPVAMLVFTYVIAHNLVLSPLFGLPSLPLPESLWDLLQVGMSGYIGARTLEKVTPAVTEAFVAHANARHARVAADAQAGALAGAAAAIAQAQK
jgi:hypothetical protein